MPVHFPSGVASSASCFSRRTLSLSALALSGSVAAGSKSTAVRARSFRRTASAELAFSLIGICHILPSNPPPTGRPQSSSKPSLRRLQTRNDHARSIGQPRRPNWASGRSVSTRTSRLGQNRAPIFAGSKRPSPRTAVMWVSRCCSPARVASPSRSCPTACCNVSASARRTASASNTSRARGLWLAGRHATDGGVRRARHRNDPMLQP